MREKFPLIILLKELSLALCETTDDIKDIKLGYGVSVVKDEWTWVTPMLYETDRWDADNTQGIFTLDYSEYLRLFLNTAMMQ